MSKQRLAAIIAVSLAAAGSGTAQAQESDYAALMALGDGALEDALQTRYDAGLALSNDPAIVAADNARYLWALEAKVQCGIALGFLKSSTRDETSIRNCDRAATLMNRMPQPQIAAVAPVAPRPVAQPPRRVEGCDEANIVFFDFDSAALTGEAGQTLATVADNVRNCSWQSLAVVGHADQSGSDDYNLQLSRERAEAVATALRARGVTIGLTTSAQGESNPRVPMPDGSRNPQNRRVEIDAN